MVVDVAMAFSGVDESYIIATLESEWRLQVIETPLRASRESHAAWCAAAM